MSVNFSNISQNYPVYNNGIKNTQNSNISFKGNNEHCNSTEFPDSPYCNCSTIKVHPMYALVSQLLKDGYTTEEIKEAKIFGKSILSDIDLSDPNLLSDVEEGKITKDDIFSSKEKKTADIQAMFNTYLALKEKFNNEDTEKYVAKMDEMFEEIYAFFRSRGEEPEKSKLYSPESMILRILHYANQKNEGLIQELLNDKTFNNVYIEQALIDPHQTRDYKYSLEALKMAQEVGYDKEFTRALAIIIGEANENNMGVIKKLLNEQDFFIDNDEFISDGLMAFLRGWDGLAMLYEQNPDITMKEIKELIESAQSEEDVD